MILTPGDPCVTFDPNLYASCMQNDNTILVMKFSGHDPFYVGVVPVWNVTKFKVFWPLTPKPLVIWSGHH